MFIRQETHPRDVPAEFLKSAFAHLEAAERLNAEMVNGTWTGSYQRGQVVMWLTFHATELFLKGFISKVSPSASITGHTLPKLKEQLETITGVINFQIPFGGEGPEDFEGIDKHIQEYDRTAHERLRYPTDRKGLSWSGVVGFSAQPFAETLRELRSEVEELYVKLFAQ